MIVSVLDSAPAVDTVRRVPTSTRTTYEPSAT